MFIYFDFSFNNFIVLLQGKFMALRIVLALLLMLFSVMMVSSQPNEQTNVIDEYIDQAIDYLDNTYKYSAITDDEKRRIKICLDYKDTSLLVLCYRCAKGNPWEKDVLLRCCDNENGVTDWCNNYVARYN